MAERTCARDGRPGGRGPRTGRGTARAVALLGVLAVLLGGIWALSAGTAQAVQTGPAAGSRWKVEPTPNPAGATISELSAVSCTSGRACTAVGSRAASLSSRTFTLAQRWDGTRWRIQRTALPAGATSGTLFGVSCPSALACTAVGAAFRTVARRDVNLAESWNGTSWRVQAIPQPKGAAHSALHAVSCTSRRACTAVGRYETAAGRVFTVAERWNGARWAIQAAPRPAGVTAAQFLGVSCATARTCTAVGYTTGPRGTRPLAERWNGTAWHIQAIPLPHASPGGMLAAVSCTSPRACTATGGSFGTTGPTLAVRWNGTRWHVQRTLVPADFRTSRQQPELNGVSCASATACTASGAYGPGGHPAYFIETWNGHRWRLVTAPRPARFAAGALNGISCVPARCTAVGAWSGGAVPVATLALAN
jgi:hypothetical protein